MSADTRTQGPTERNLRRIAVATIAGFFIADGLLRSLYEYFGGQAVGSDRSFADSFGSEITGALATAFVFFLVVLPASRRWPLRGNAWARHLGFHIGTLLVYTVTKTLFMWAVRIPLWPALGLGSYDYGNLLYRFPMEAAGDVLGYALLTGAVHAWDAWKRLKEEEVKSAKLEAQLNATRLDALKDRLQPHFLFNTLNTIGSMVHSDPENADRMITRLSDLLRRALEAPASDLVTVREEVALVHEYVEIMMVRFADRARVSLNVASNVADARLPPFLLQPLVENAFKYGIEPRPDWGEVSVSVEERNSALEIRVTDDGPGLAAPRTSAGSGIGLASVRDRLDLLFGSHASLTVKSRPEGGVCAAIRLPLTYEAAPGPAGEETS